MSQWHLHREDQGANQSRKWPEARVNNWRAEVKVSICPRIALQGPAFQGLGPGNPVYFQLIWVCPNLLWKPEICMSTLRDPNKHT